MSNIATTIEQSKELVRLGLDPNTADMYYLPQVMNEGETLWPIDEGYNLDDADQPAWSLSALLEVIKGVFAYTTIAISGASKGFNFIRCKDLNYIWTHDVNADSPIDAAYEMVRWLLEQGLIKKGGNNETE